MQVELGKVGTGRLDFTQLWLVVHNIATKNKAFVMVRKEKSLKSSTRVFPVLALVVFCVFVSAIVTYLVVISSTRLRCKWEHKRRLDAEGAFPVDVVYTWVDGQDREWRSMVASFWEKARSDVNLTHSTMREPVPRDDHRDELYYSVRSVSRNLPWVSNIHIVTQRPQIPRWMNGERSLVLPSGITVRVVHHDEIFDGVRQHRLPVFNSNIIQSQIGRIPNLAEHFILFDDDCFVGKPMAKSDFFKSDGRPVYATDPAFALNLLRGDQFGSQCRNLVKMLKEKGVRGAFGTAHVASPHTKANWSLGEELYRKEYDALDRFRSHDDFCIQYISANLAAKHPRGSGVHWSRGKAVGGKRFEYWAGEESILKKLAPGVGLPDMFCINEDATQRIIQALENRFPGW